MKAVLLEIVHSPAAIAAIVAAILAFISGVLGPLVQLLIGRKQAAASQRAADAAMLSAENAGSREIARMRLVWMDKLRDTLSQFHAILMTVEEVDGAAEARELSRLGTELDLLLNRNDKAQKALWDVADKIYKNPSRQERQDMDEALVAAGRAVFKSEWEKIKAEMRGEPFKTGE
jgi:hypothetical protein